MNFHRPSDIGSFLYSCTWNNCIFYLALDKLIYIIPITEHYDRFMVFGFSTDPCTTKECPVGSECKEFPPTGEAYCDPSCDVDNGGCDDDQLCIVVKPPCAFPFEQPCTSVVICVNEGTA